MLCKLFRIYDGKKVNASIPAKIITLLIFSVSNITIDKISSAKQALNASFPTTDFVQKGPLPV